MAVMRLARLVLIAAALAAPCFRAPRALAADDAAGPEPIAVLRSALAVGGVGHRARSPVHDDAVEALLVSGRWQAPRTGRVVHLPDGSETRWVELSAGDDGFVAGDELAGGWAFWSVESATRRVALLDARGPSEVFVNGVPRGANPYAYGWWLVPVELQAGRNELLFRVGRGRLSARLLPAPVTAAILTGDPTLPDAVVGEPLDAPAGIVVANTTTTTLSGLDLVARVGDAPPTRTAVPALPPLGQAKFPVRLQATAPSAADAPQPLVLTLERTGAVVDRVEIALDTRSPDEARLVTFVSRIDGSAQRYGWLPATRPAPEGGRLALVVSVHGAGVGARGQASAYSPKSWAQLVAPTNRRPFGFDWEDWGRLDALEVTEHAQEALRTDPLRTYLVGHSMGGHGTWQLGATLPDRWAAIGPSAGWASFWSYAGGERPAATDAVGAVLRRAAAPSDTMALLRNLAPRGVYVLHGDADDNVPVTEARALLEALSPWHHDVESHEEPGAGHWWDVSDERGADCVDWPPLMDFLARHALPPRPLDVDFTTMIPGVSADMHWLRIEQQQVALEPSRAQLRLEPFTRRIVGTTTNVARLSIDLDALEGAGDVTVALDAEDDGDTPAERVVTPPEGSARLSLARGPEGWQLASPPPPSEKNPARAGSFKDAFRHRPLLVYGTAGSAAETAAALARARLDAETFQYRGNGLLEVVADRDFDATREHDRSVVLYGNADTNRAWRELLGGGPVDVRRGRVRVGDRTVRGADLAVLLIRPRPGSDVASVAAVAATGAVGMRLTATLPTFISGIHWPDLVVADSSLPRAGAAGLVAAGFFGNDWSLEHGDLAWRGEGVAPAP